MARDTKVATYQNAYLPPNDHERPRSAEKKEIWSAMLDSVASGKRLPEKNILVLGGTPDSQREFLETLAIGDSTKIRDRFNTKLSPIANNFALGYTYQDVLDADQEDIIARISLYLLTDPSPSFTPLLQPLLTPQTIPNTLIILLLDWSQPWFWLRELKKWIKLLRRLLDSLDMACKQEMAEVMLTWQDRSRGRGVLEGRGVGNLAEGEVSLPLGPGEWEDALGLPICVVCQNADQMEYLEKERSWKEDQFDFVLQSLRTILLKHGASLIYTTPSTPSPLQGLIHASLGVQSLLDRQPLRHNVIDRDKVVVPPNWDSWGKIRVLREGFDLEAINEGWSHDIIGASFDSSNSTADGMTGQVTEARATSAISKYEDTIRSPSQDALHSIAASETNANVLEVTVNEVQVFLSEQFDALEKIRSDIDGLDTSHQPTLRQTGENPELSERLNDSERKVNEHIGPVQFNMGGIQVDADDMLQRLKDRQTYTTIESKPSGPSSSSDSKPENEALASFFASLMKRGSGGGNQELSG